VIFFPEEELYTKVRGNSKKKKKKKKKKKMRNKKKMKGTSKYFARTFPLCLRTWHSSRRLLVCVWTTVP